MPNTSISFPASPTAGQTYTYGSTTYTFDGSYWSVNGSSVDQVSTNDIQNGAVTPAKLSTGGPSWTSGGNLTITGDLTVDTNTLHIDASTNSVGIGITSPTRKLHLHEATAATTNYISITNSSTGTTGNDGLIFGVNAFNEGIFWNCENNALIFGTNNNERVTIQPDGRIVLTTGQITFPATQIASANANTLDDYEEGDWVPQLTIGNSTTGIVYSVVQGSYVKIGRLVFIEGRFILSNKGSNTGAVGITNFPFVNVGPTPIPGSLAAGAHGCLTSCYYAGCTSNITSPPTGYLSGSSATLIKTGAGAVSNLLDSDITSSFDLIFNAVYRTNT